MNQLILNGLTKTYPNAVKALNNVSLEINNGMFGLLGPNGAGKSTLMKTIVGLQTADSGGLTFNGVDISADTMFIKKQLGFLPQDFGVYPKISAYNLLMHLGALKGLTNRSALKEQVLSLLQKVNLFNERKKEVFTFSGGMRQRFGIAQALLGDPKIVIVDEPTAGLDPEERNRFNNLLSEIGEDIIVILSTHLVEDVRNLCTQMAVMNKGSILAHGKPNDFVEELSGKLWQKIISKNERELYEQKYTVISSQLNAGKLNIHVLSTESLQDGFRQIEPTLEDVYFSIQHQNN